MEDETQGPASCKFICLHCGDSFKDPERSCPSPDAGREPYKDSSRGGHRFYPVKVGNTGPRRTTAPSFFLVKSLPVVPGKQIQLPLPPRAHDLHVTGITLRVTEPEHWLVHDILIGGDTLLVDGGDLPGELFADQLGRALIPLGHLRAQEELIVHATYTGPLSAVSLAYEVSGTEVPTEEEAANFAFLPLSGNVPIQGSAQVQAKIGLPPEYAFLPEEIVLRDPEKWIVSNVRSGNLVQFAASGAVPGVLFGRDNWGCQPHFITALGDSDFCMTVNYAGPELYGEPFVCGVVGRVVRLRPQVPL